MPIPTPHDRYDPTVTTWSLWGESKTRATLKVRQLPSDRCRRKYVRASACSLCMCSILAYRFSCGSDSHIHGSYLSACMVKIHLVGQCLHRPIGCNFYRRHHMKFWHYYCLKSPLCLIGYVFGTQDMAFLWVAVLSAFCIPLFAYLEENQWRNFFMC